MSCRELAIFDSSREVPTHWSQCCPRPLSSPPPRSIFPTRGPSAGIASGASFSQRVSLYTPRSHLCTRPHGVLGFDSRVLAVVHALASRLQPGQAGESFVLLQSDVRELADEMRECFLGSRYFIDAGQQEEGQPFGSAIHTERQRQAARRGIPTWRTVLHRNDVRVVSLF